MPVELERSTRPTAQQHRAANAALTIEAFGMACALGTDAITACAASRAGLSRPAALPGQLASDPETGDVEPVIGHAISFLTKGFSGAGRLARIGSLALNDLVAKAKLRPEELQETPVVLALRGGYYADAAELAENGQPFTKTAPPKTEDTQDFEERARTIAVPRMFELAGLAAPARLELVFDGPSGFGLALQRAAAMLVEKRTRRCLVGAIDSCCDPEMLGVLDGLQLIKTGTMPVGFAPGEGAALMLVGRPSDSTGPGASITMPVHRADGAHQFDPAVHSCSKLAEVVREAIARSGADGCGLAIGSHNGTNWSAEELGRTLAISPEFARVVDHWFPAIGFGETGAAYGALATCVAARAFERGYAGHASALVWASSPSGSKSAFVVSGE
jgi:3-oxoacyl-[acyl-carrier-protein] synthase-1